MSVNFALAAPLKEEGGFVYRPGKFFEIGKIFEDRAGIKFGVTRAEAEAAVASFKRAPLGVIHEPTPIDGLFGHIERLWIEGNDIMGEFAVPKWLHEGKEGKDLAISSEWNVATKQPGGASYVFEGAVKDSVIKAAFSANPEAEKARREAIDALFERHDTPTGQMAIQEVHDKCARAGAVCDKKNVAKMAARHEATVLQTMHDLSVEHGAKCASGDYPYRSMSMFSEAKAIPSTTPARPADSGANTMHPLIAKFNKLRAALKALGGDDSDIPELTEGDLPVQTAQFSEQQQALFNAQSERISDLIFSASSKDAETFVAGLQATGRITTVEMPGVLAQFAQAALDDSKVPVVVKFSTFDPEKKAAVEKTGTRVDSLKALFSMRPSNGMTQEMVGHGRPVNQDDVTALFSHNSEETTEERTKRIQKGIAAERAKHGLKPVA